jgi:hypothetical protein
MNFISYITLLSNALIPRILHYITLYYYLNMFINISKHSQNHKFQLHIYHAYSRTSHPIR